MHKLRTKTPPIRFLSPREFVELLMRWFGLIKKQIHRIFNEMGDRLVSASCFLLKSFSQFWRDRDLYPVPSEFLTSHVFILQHIFGFRNGLS